MIEPQSDELFAYLKQEGIPLDSIERVEHSFETKDLIDGKVDAISAYVTNEPYFLDKAGFKYHTYTPRSVGIDFYGDNLFTTEQELKNHPARVKAFREATLRGWQYAMDHPEEIIDLIVNKYSQQREREFYLFEYKRMLPLIRTDLIEIGYMNPGRWHHIAETYADLRQTESKSARSRYERLLMDLTQAELQDQAEFDHEGFTLRQTPAELTPGDAPLGRYELPRRSGDAHLYRTGHPLAQALIAQAKARTLPVARLRFNYDGYGAKVSTVQALRGQSGWLCLSVLSVDALGMVEDYLLLAGVTDAGQALHEEDARKLLCLPAEVLEADLLMHPPAALDDDLKRLEHEQLATVNTRNLGYFDTEVQKLDAWADDLKVGLENEVKELDREIKDVRRTATVAATLEEKLQCQKRQRELEGKRNQLRRKIFDRQDEIDGQRNKLIEALESRLDRKMLTTAIFTIQWSLQ